MKILVSACLLGMRVRYDGKSRPDDGVIGLMEQHELIPVCAEVFGGLPTPRVPAERIGNRVITKDGRDVTEEYVRGAEEIARLARLYGCKHAVLKEKSPSCGKDNDYGHPHKETIDLYRDAGLPMLRTDELGSILAGSDGRDITITWENHHASPADVEPSDGFGTYIANKNSKTLHTPFCSGLPKKENQLFYESYEQALADGYKPCGSCIG